MVVELAAMTTEPLSVRVELAPRLPPLRTVREEPEAMETVGLVMEPATVSCPAFTVVGPE